MPYKRFVSFADVFPFLKRKKNYFQDIKLEIDFPIYYYIVLKLPDVNLIVADMFEFLGNMHGN